jgi:hypothetical protein
MIGPHERHREAPWSVVPPVFMGSKVCRPFEASHMDNSKFVTTFAGLLRAK